MGLALLASGVVCAVGTSQAAAGTALGTQSTTVGGSIADIAGGQTGSFPCTPGGEGYVNPGDSSNYSCDGSGGKQENWCADFAAWAWGRAGVTTGVTSYLNGMAASFDTYGANEKTISSTPHLGDAVVFKDSSGTIQHVGLVTGLPGGTEVTITSGNDYYVPPGTPASVAADIEANGQVQTTTYANYAEGQSAEGWLIKEYVSPVGGAPSVPAGFNVTLDADGAPLTSGEHLSGTVNLTAIASAQGYIYGLDYTITGPDNYSTTINGGSGATNYAQPWNAAGLADGTYTIKATADETDGQAHVYGPISFTVEGKRGVSRKGWVTVKRGNYCDDHTFGL